MLAVLAHGGQLALPAVVAVELGPDGIVEAAPAVVVVVAPGQAGERGADDVGGVEAGDGGEGLVDRLHPVFGIHDDDGFVRILEHARRLAQVVFDLLARGDVHFHAEHLLRVAVALDREVVRMQPQAPAGGGLDPPVARRRRLAVAPDAGDGVVEFALLVEVGHQLAEGLAQRMAGRDAEQLGAGMVPETHDAGAVARVHGHRRRQFDRRHETVEPVERLAAGAVELDGFRQGAGRCRMRRRRRLETVLDVADRIGRQVQPARPTGPARRVSRLFAHGRILF